MTYAMPPAVAPVRDTFDAAGNLALFLTVNTGSCYGRWSGRMRAADQRALLGSFRFGKRHLCVDGAEETVRARRQVCFGTDFDIEITNWRDLVPAKRAEG